VRRPGSTSKYVSVSNVGDTEKNVRLNWETLGIKAKKTTVRDLWTHKEMGAVMRCDVVRPHASVLVKVTP